MSRAAALQRRARKGKADLATQLCVIGITTLPQDSHTWRVPESGHLLPFPQAPDGIELRHLRAFVAVAEELNFGRAAERLYISQPALSRQIRALEQFVGCELLRRSTHRVELTIAGEALLDRARKLLRDVDEAVAEALAVGGELLGRAIKLLEPLSGLVAEESGIHDAREAFERLQAEFSPPPGITVRPVTAGGVPSLVVSPADVTRANGAVSARRRLPARLGVRLSVARRRAGRRRTDRRAGGRLPPRSRASVSRGSGRLAERVPMAARSGCRAGACDGRRRLRRRRARDVPAAGAQTRTASPLLAEPSSSAHGSTSGSAMPSWRGRPHPSTRPWRQKRRWSGAPRRI